MCSLTGLVGLGGGAHVGSGMSSANAMATPADGGVLLGLGLPSGAAEEEEEEQEEVIEVLGFLAGMAGGVVFTYSGRLDLCGGWVVLF